MSLVTGPKTQTKEESDLQCSQVQRQVCNSSDKVFNDIPEKLCSNMAGWGGG